jgi:hypothetical protein
VINEREGVWKEPVVRPWWVCLEGVEKSDKPVELLSRPRIEPGPTWIQVSGLARCRMAATEAKMIPYDQHVTRPLARTSDLWNRPTGISLDLTWPSDKHLYFLLVTHTQLMYNGKLVTPYFAFCLNFQYSQTRSLHNLLLIMKHKLIVSSCPYL